MPWRFRKIHRRTPAIYPFFVKTAGQQKRDFITGIFLWILRKLLKAPSQDKSRWLLCNFNNRQYSTLPANLSQNIPAQIWIACSNILSHCVKSFQIRIYFWSIFGHFSWMSSCVNRSCFSFFFRSIFSASSRGNKRSVVLIKFFRYIWITT